MAHDKNWIRFGFSALMLALSACAAQGPGDSTEGDDPGTEEAQAPIRGEGPAGEHAKGKHDRHRGTDHLIQAALDELDLSASQKSTIEALKTDMPEKPAEMQAFMTALAAGVRANSIDEAQMNEKIDAISRQGSALRAQHAAALEKLHATLTSAQRKELVDSMKARMADKEEKLAEMRDRAEEDGKDGPRGKGGKLRGGPLAHVMKQLDLSDDQREAVKKAVESAGLVPPDREEMKAKFEKMHASKKAMIEAFASDSFDADALLPELEGKGKEHLGSMVKATRAVLPILDAAQRDKLAGMLESGDLFKGKAGKHGKHGKAGKRGPAPAETE
ncbi:MAG: Spy/CpxP family protein refolding chaperone [Myxococcales bacterium]|nr:Spy/CpxP family protein refolding chaperone [Myxococcales bacterium]